jgi:hypothetical protein
MCRRSWRRCHIVPFGPALMQFCNRPLCASPSSTRSTQPKNLIQNTSSVSSQYLLNNPGRPPRFLILAQNRRNQAMLLQNRETWGTSRIFTLYNNESYDVQRYKYVGMELCERLTENLRDREIKLYMSIRYESTCVCFDDGNCFGTLFAISIRVLRMTY